MTSTPPIHIHSSSSTLLHAAVHPLSTAPHRQRKMRATAHGACNGGALLLSPSVYTAQLQEASAAVTAVLHRRFPSLSPSVGVVLGSGLSDFASHLTDVEVVPYSSIPHMPRPAVSGHHGDLVVGRIEAPQSPSTLSSSLVLCFSGRVHSYEGHLSASLCFIARLCHLLGARCLLLTNSAGGCGPNMVEGSVMMITDHIRACAVDAALDCAKDGGGRLGEGEVDCLTSPFVYARALQPLVRAAALGAGVKLHEGAYHWSSGPTYETPAEVRAGMALGVSAFGMSTVPEVVAAAALRLPTVALSLCTNMAAGLSAEVLTHEGVKAVANLAGPQFRALVHRLLADLARHFDEGQSDANSPPATALPPHPQSVGSLEADLQSHEGWTPSFAEVSAAASAVAAANAGFPSPLCALVLGDVEAASLQSLLSELRSLPLSAFAALASPPLSRSALSASLHLGTWTGGSGPEAARDDGDGAARRLCVVRGVGTEGFTASEAAFLAQLLALVGVRAVVCVGVGRGVGAAPDSSAPSLLLCSDALDRTLERWPPLCLSSSPPEPQAGPVFDSALSSLIQSSLPPPSSATPSPPLPGCARGSVGFFSGPSWPGALERSAAAAAGCGAVSPSSPALPIYAAALGLASAAVFDLSGDFHQSAVGGGRPQRPLLSALLSALGRWTESSAASSPALSFSPSPSPSPLPLRRPAPYRPAQERWELSAEGAQRLLAAVGGCSLPPPPSPSVAPLRALLVLHPAVGDAPPPGFASLYTAPAASLAPSTPADGWALHIGSWQGRSPRPHPTQQRRHSRRSAACSLSRRPLPAVLRLQGRLSPSSAARQPPRPPRIGASPTACEASSPSCARSLWRRSRASSSPAPPRRWTPRPLRWAAFAASLTT